MRILIAETPQYIAFHGQAIFTVNLAEGLARRGHEVLVVASSESGHANHLQRNGVEVEAVRSLSLKLFHPDAHYPLFSGKAVHRIFNDFQPEIVHIQDHYVLSRSILITAHKHGGKVVGTNHFMPENLAPYVPGLAKLKPAFNWVLWHWTLNTYNRLDMVTAPSKTAADMLRSQGLRTPVIPISCGIDLRRFHPDPKVDRQECRMRCGLDPQRTVFLFVGRIDKEKHLDLLLRAVHQLDRDDIQLAIGGKGAALNWLKTMAEELNLGQRIHFIGYVAREDLPRLLNTVDIFVMPSEAELLSIATLEAMACGLPVLAADAVALPELVTDNVNGLLFRHGDVEDAARCMALLADRRERWPAMGAAGLARAKSHSLEDVLGQYEKLYQSVLLCAPFSRQP